METFDVFVVRGYKDGEEGGNVGPAPIIACYADESLARLAAGDNGYIEPRKAIYDELYGMGYIIEGQPMKLSQTIDIAWCPTGVTMEPILPEPVHIWKYGLSFADKGNIELFLNEGRKIMAIKFVRDTIHVGLKEAKDIVEEMIEERG